MRAPRHSSGPGRRLLVTLAVSGGALYLASVGLVTHRSSLQSGAARSELRAIADVVVANLEPAVIYEDPLAATRTLGALRSTPQIAWACLYAADGDLFAHYAREATHNSCPVGAHFDPDRPSARDPNELTLELEEAGRILSTFVIRAESIDPVAQLARFAVPLGATLLAWGVIALLLTIKFRTAQLGIDPLPEPAGNRLQQHPEHQRPDAMNERERELARYRASLEEAANERTRTRM